MEFLNEFDFNKKYVFDKDLYKENMLTVKEFIADKKFQDYWINLCDNKEVQIVSTKMGAVEDYTVICEWCREIPTKIRLMNENDFK